MSLKVENERKKNELTIFFAMWKARVTKRREINATVAADDDYDA